MARSRHRIPIGYVRSSDPISDRYQAEVDSHTNRLAKAHARAVKRVDEARARAARVTLTETRPTRIDAAWRELATREAELAEIERLMQPGNTAPANNRGVASFRKVPR